MALRSFRTLAHRWLVRPGALAVAVVLLAGGGLLTSADAAPPGRAAAFSWPLAPPHPVVRGFQAPATPYSAGHRGVDLGGTSDAEVLAAGQAVVAFAGDVAGRPVVSLDHGDGLRTTYEPVTPRVVAGQRVGRGETIGLLQPGHPGCAAPGPDPAAEVGTGACLHWGARRGAEYVDPLGLLGSGRVRLLPWRDQDTERLLAGG